MTIPRNMITADDRKAIRNFLELGGPLSAVLKAETVCNSSLRSSLDAD
jgi:hypothetical protein